MSNGRKDVTLTDDKGAGWGSPSPSGEAVTPSDTDDLSQIARLYVGTSGNLRVLLANDTDPITLANVPVGYQPLIVQRVYATDTTADNIVALFMD